MGFLDQIPVFTSFRQSAEEDLYLAAPDDWWVITGDITDSTSAIEAGKYKEVNMAGASLITAVCNLFPEYETLPFAFGGDGASILIPGEKLKEVKHVLNYCRSAVYSSFGLEMYVGMIQMKDIRIAGYDVRVARLKLSESIFQTLFWGEGISYAETIIKSEKQSPLKKYVDGFNILNGLECRWQEIPSDQDEIAAYIIKARGNSDREKSEIYTRCMDLVNRVYGSESEFNPVRRASLAFTGNGKKLRVEWKLRTWNQPLLKKFTYAWHLAGQIVAGWFLMRFGINTGSTEWGRYKYDLVQHVDFRKFGDGLRLLATGTVSMREQMENFLEDELKDGTLNYGIHSSPGLIITCYVMSYQKKHIHFVDGSDGGYALAARMLKNQAG